MKKHTLLLAWLMTIGGLALSEEFFPNGGFEESTATNTIIYKGACLVKTTYGKSLFLGKPVGGIEVEALPDAVLSGQEDSNWKGFPYCSFELSLTPKTKYELSFDYMAGNIRNGGEFAITDSQGKVIKKSALPVNNLDWNHVGMPFQAGDDGKATVTFRIGSARDLGGMAVDNVSVRILGDLLPRWGGGNILYGEGDLPGWFWQIDGSAKINCDLKGLTVETSAKDTMTVKVKTPSIMPGKEYCLRLGGQSSKASQAVAEIRLLDGTRREIAAPLKFNLKCNANRQFMNNWFFSVPQTTMLVELTVKYILDGETTASFDTPRIFAALKKH